MSLLFKDKIKGDKWGPVKLSILKNKTTNYYIEKKRIEMKFYPEIAIFGQVARKYKTRYINKVVKEVKYSNDGLSLNKLSNSYPKKFLLYINLIFALIILNMILIVSLFTEFYIIDGHFTLKHLLFLN